jgi:hypothetical protein
MKRSNFTYYPKAFAASALLVCILVFFSTGYGAENEEMEENAKDLIVKVTSKGGFGAGIIIGVSSGYIFIATADHLLGKSQNAELEFRALQYVPVPAVAINRHPQQDFALLRAKIPNELSGETFAFDRLKYTVAHKGIPVRVVGHPGGEFWDSPETDISVQNIESDEIKFYFSCQPGHSGGGLFNRDWELVGMIKEQGVQYCRAVSMKFLLSSVPRNIVDLRYADKPSPDQEKGARISGRILYNGYPITNYTKANAVLGLVEVVSWKGIPIDYRYSSENAEYVISNVPPGKYSPFVRIESGWPFDKESGGDYYGRISGMNKNIVVAPHSKNIHQDLKVVHVIHLTKPLDNQNRRTHVSDPPEKLYHSFYGPSAEKFEWKPVPDAAGYELHYLLEDGNTKKRIDYKTFKTNKTYYYPKLNVTTGNNYYMFRITAHNASNEMIGHFQNYYKDGSGGWFEFTVAAKP